ncbi:MAG: hypothetical protein Q8912_06545 [Bacillota bacterium]|nr:hypothetical protein [Bacillota bacterium]
MWPRRKIQLVASSAAVGIDGVRAILKEFQLEFSEVEPAMGDLPQESSEQWFDQSRDCTFEEAGPVTELVFWPEVTEDDFWRKRAVEQGINQQSIQSFLHSIFEDELILRVSEPTVFIEGRPLLGHILTIAGFEPSFLWPIVDGEWQCERRQGIHWLLPDFWLKGLAEMGSLGRDGKQVEEKSTWVVRETGIDFYRAPEGLKFVGHLSRWPEPIEELLACQTIAKCIDLGVSWFDIKAALSSLWTNIKIISTDNLRWNIDDFGWNGGTSGEKLSAASIDHVEDRWSG